MTNKAQSQASLTDQLQALIAVANKEGLYDAADFLKAHVEKVEEKSQTVRAYQVMFDDIEWNAAYSIRPSLPDKKTYVVPARNPREAVKMAKDVAYEEESFLIKSAVTEVTLAAR